MKRFRFCFVLAVTLLFTLSVSLPVYANMAAPEDPDIGTAITFEKNDAIAVRSEVLDINVDGTVAYITATYGMENTTDEAVSTPAMFIAPNMGGGSVVVDGADTPDHKQRAIRFPTTRKLIPKIGNTLFSAVEMALLSGLPTPLPSPCTLNGRNLRCGRFLHLPSGRMARARNQSRFQSRGNRILSCPRRHVEGL